MDKTQLLSLELTTDCNLSGQHARCPISSPERFRHVNTLRRLDDDMICFVVEQAYRKHGFRGLVAWHYYCEPLVEQERMFALMRRICQSIPESRFLLWTNGTLLPEDLEAFKEFERIVITDYGNLPSDRVSALVGQQSGVTVHRWSLDSRLDVDGPSRTDPCGRMFVEMPIDAYGNVHACCFDWQGRVPIGNVYAKSFDAIVERWQSVRHSISCKAMAENAPVVCLRCTHRHPGVAAILPPVVAAPGIVQAANDYLRDMRSDSPIYITRSNRRIAVVFVSYLKVPYGRLRDHFQWNDAIYKRSGAHVYVVTDREYNVPQYAECVVYPLESLPIVDGKPRFSLCATKNAGIDKALRDGADIVLVMDVDHTFTAGCWEWLVAVRENEARVPLYRMIRAHGDLTNSHIDQGATGVIAMTASNWRKIHWDEGCIGYGADDGIMLRDIRSAGLTMLRDVEVYHVEHPGATAEPNIPGHGRDGCYGRDEFNFDNFNENRKLHTKR